MFGGSSLGQRPANENHPKPANLERPPCKAILLDGSVWFRVVPVVPYDSSRLVLVSYPSICQEDVWLRFSDQQANHNCKRLPVSQATSHRALQPPPSPRPGNWPELRAARLTGSLPTLALPGQRVTQSGWRLAGGAHANFLLIFLLKCFSPFVCPWSGNRDSVCGFRSLTRDLLLAVFCAPLSPSTKKPA